MKVVTCPEHFYHSNWTDFFIDNVIFLAGGITDCPDWQKEMIQRFKDCENTVLLNPRRGKFDITDPTASEFQINWEYQNLRKADAILFWFPYQTLCPITLYELGAAAYGGDTIFVGAHPAYPRFFDIKKQLELIRPEVKVRDNFTDLVNDVKEWIDDRNS